MLYAAGVATKRLRRPPDMAVSASGAGFGVTNAVPRAALSPPE